MMMGTPLEELKNQVGDRPSWRRSKSSLNLSTKMGLFKNPPGRVNCLPLNAEMLDLLQAQTALPNSYQDVESETKEETRQSLV